MGCHQCSKSNDKNNLNLEDQQDTEQKVNNILNEDFTTNSHIGIKNDIIDSVKNMVNGNTADENHVLEETTKKNKSTKLERKCKNYLLKYLFSDNANKDILECINHFRSNPNYVADLLIEESKNIQVTIKNGKEVVIYKDNYCISGKEELFMKVSNFLRNFSPLEPLELSDELILEPEIVRKTKPSNDEEKVALQREKEANYKFRLKNLKERLSGKFRKIEALTHTTNENVVDSIIIQIISNFNIEKTSKAKRPFDMIFSSEFKYIGVYLIGNKKMTGNIIFAC